MTAPSSSLSTVEARDRLSEVINRAAFGKERVVLTRRGKPLVALVPIEDVEALEALEDQRDAQEVRDRLAEWKQEVTTLRASGEDEGGAIPLEEVARRHGVTLRKAGE